MATLDDRRWTAVRARAAEADGRFVYAVSSTGVYCRPSCPSRRPLRRNVRFFSRPETAERAGFRACRRCRPDAQDPRVSKIRQACAVIAARRGARISLTALAAHVGLSPFHLQRTLTRVVGISPREYADALRAGSLKARLRAGRPIAGAMYEAGYGSSSRLYERAPMLLGMTPGEYRGGGRSARIRYTTVASPLGRMLVAATDRGLCAVRLGATAATLTAELKREFPAATLVRDARGLDRWVRHLLGRTTGVPSASVLPLDVQATAFQWRVWRQLCTIPAGETRSYAEIARAIRRPGAARAVAGACASNPLAPAIPCHRVVPASGGVADIGGALSLPRLKARESVRRVG